MAERAAPQPRIVLTYPDLRPAAVRALKELIDEEDKLVKPRGMQTNNTELWRRQIERLSAEIAASRECATPNGPDLP